MAVEGVEVDIDGDVATVAFTDPALKGVGIGKLLTAGGPERVKRVSRPRLAYKVHVDIAIEAGFVDGGGSPTYDDGKPDMDWSRAAINAYAGEHGVENPEALPNKQAVLDAIAEADTPSTGDGDDNPPTTPGDGNGDASGDPQPTTEASGDAHDPPASTS